MLKDKLLARFPFLVNKFDLILLNALLILIVVGVVLSLIYTSFFNKDQVVIKQLESAEELENVTVVSYSGDYTINFDSLPLYELSSYQPASYFLNRISSLYNLNSSPDSSGFYYNSDKSVSLFSANDGDLLSLSIIENNPLPDTSLPSLEELDQQALTSLKNLGFDNSLFELNEEKISYQNFTNLATEYHEVETPSQATSVSLVYQQMLNGIPIYFSSRPEDHVQMSFSAKGLYQLDFVPFEVKPRQKENYSLLPIDIAIENIRQGKYSTLSGLMRTNNLGKNRIVAIDLTEFDLVYRFSLDEQLLIPYYDFRGTIELADGFITPVSLTTPAIQAQLIK